MTILLYLIFYTICALNIVWGLQKKRSNALYVGAFIVMFILMTFNFDGPDIGTYMATYRAIGNASTLHAAIESTYMEKGYTVLMFGANKIGLDFYAFRVILTVVCFGLIGSAIKYFKVNPNIIIGLYMAYLFFMDAIQFRNFIAMCIVLFSTKYLFKKAKISYLQYAIGICFAGFFHVISFAYLVLIVVKFIHSAKTMRVLFWCAIGLFAICLVFRSLLIREALRVVDALSRWFSYVQTVAEIRFNPFIALTLQLVAIGPLFRYGNKIADKNMRDKANTVLAIELVVLFLLPGSFINSNLNRIYRNMLILNTIGLAILYENTGKHTMTKQIAGIAQFVVIGGWLAIDIYRNNAERLIGKLMSCNLFCMPATTNDILFYFAITVFSVLAVLTIKGIFAMKAETQRARRKAVSGQTGRNGGAIS